MKHPKDITYQMLRFAANTQGTDFHACHNWMSEQLKCLLFALPVLVISDYTQNNYALMTFWQWIRAKLDNKLAIWLLTMIGMHRLFPTVNNTAMIHTDQHTFHSKFKKYLHKLYSKTSRTPFIINPSTLNQSNPSFQHHISLERPCSVLSIHLREWFCSWW